MFKNKISKRSKERPAGDKLTYFNCQESQFKCNINSWGNKLMQHAVNFNSEI